MKPKPRTKSVVPKVDPYIEGLMAKLLDRLVSLERKMDAMLAQGRPGQNAPAPPAPRHERTMYEAICADCSKVCEVPFKPSEDRAVYCKECFAHRKSGGNGHKPGMPVLTPVAMPQKPAMKPAAAAKPVSVKKTPPAKKTKKKK